MTVATSSKNSEKMKIIDIFSDREYILSELKKAENSPIISFQDLYKEVKLKFTK